LARWVGHFNEVLNQPVPDELFIFDNEREFKPIEASLEDFQISETAKAICKLKNNEAAGLDEIPAELLKQGGEPVAEVFTELSNHIWHTEEIPKEWREGIIIPLPKKDVLATAVIESDNPAVYTRQGILQYAVQQTETHVNQQLREEQAGFQSGRSCTE